MFEKVSDKVKEAIEHAKKVADSQQNQFEQAAQKAEPHLHEARERLAEASQPCRHESD